MSRTRVLLLCFAALLLAIGSLYSLQLVFSLFRPFSAIPASQIETPVSSAPLPGKGTDGDHCDALQQVAAMLRNDARELRKEKSYAIEKHSSGEYAVHELWEGTGNLTSGSSRDLKPYFAGQAEEVILAHSHPPIQSRVSPPSADDIIMIMVIDRGFKPYEKKFRGMIADAEIVWEVEPPAGARFGEEVDQLGAVLTDLFRVPRIQERFNDLWPQYGRMTAAEHIFSEVRGGAYGVEANSLLRSHEKTLAGTFVADIMPLMSQLARMETSKQRATAETIVDLWAQHGVSMRMIAIEAACDTKAARR